jgi:hypothetical protein
MKKESDAIRSARIQVAGVIIAAIITVAVPSFVAFYKGCFNHESGSMVRTSGDSSTASATSGDQSNIYNIQGDMNIYGDEKIARSVTNNLIKPDPEKKEPWRIKHKGKILPLKEGIYYTEDLKPDTQISYMLKDRLIHVEYNASDGAKWYYVVNEKGDIVDYKFPIKLEEFDVIIPYGMELSRTTTPLQNGFRKIDVKLKWGKSISMIVDSNERLKQITVRGGARISRLKKTISPTLPKEESKN